MKDFNFKVVKGRKSAKDRILKIKCQCGREDIPTLIDWLIMARVKAMDEDWAYPYPARGRWMLLDFLRDGLKMDESRKFKYTAKELCKKYKIPFNGEQDA